MIGIGQAAAGDDAVGLHVIAELKARGGQAGLELLTVREPTALIDVLDGADSAIIVDALVGVATGSVHVLDLDGVSREPPGGYSSHGIGVGQAVALARVVLGEPPREVKFVAVGIERPRRHATALTPPIRAAVARAADAVLRLTVRA